MTKKVGLRVAIIWKGAVLEEQIFRGDKNERVTLSGDPGPHRVMVLPDFRGSVEAFIPIENGYRARIPEHATGSVTRQEKEERLEEVFSNAKSTGSVETAEGRKKLYDVDLEIGDWGIFTVNEVSIYFQVRDGSLVIPITAFDLPIQAPLAASILISCALQATFLMLVMLSPEYDPELKELRALDRFASFMVDDVETPPEEEEAAPDEVIEEDTTAKKAGGEEGKFGDDESEFEESKLTKIDGEMTDKIDVKNLGINKALSNNLLGSGALKNVFDGNAGIGAKVTIGMAGEQGGELQIGRGHGGMGQIGTGSGGGGQGIGRIGGIGDVDTGGGKGRTGAKVGGKRKVKVKPKMKTGTPNLGDFCDKNNIRRVVAAKANAIKYCFEKQLQTNPDLKGKVMASWQVGLDGSVMNATITSSTVNDKSVEGCVTRVIKTMRFQAPDGGICVIKYPFVFTGLE